MKTKFRIAASLAIIVGFAAAFAAATVPVFRPDLVAALFGWFAIYGLIELALISRGQLLPLNRREAPVRGFARQTESTPIVARPTARVARRRREQPLAA